MPGQCVRTGHGLVRGQTDDIGLETILVLSPQSPGHSHTVPTGCHRIGFLSLGPIHHPQTQVAVKSSLIKGLPLCQRFPHLGKIPFPSLQIVTGDQARPELARIIINLWALSPQRQYTPRIPLENILFLLTGAPTFCVFQPTPQEKLLARSQEFVQVTHQDKEPL